MSESELFGKLEPLGVKGGMAKLFVPKKNEDHKVVVKKSLDAEDFLLVEKMKLRTDETLSDQKLAEREPKALLIVQIRNK